MFERERVAGGGWGILTAEILTVLEEGRGSTSCLKIKRGKVRGRTNRLRGILTDLFTPTDLDLKLHTTD